jgi:DtxR family manganese transport transcriptional regulator
MPRTTTKSAGNGTSSNNRFERTRRDHAMELAEDYLEMIDDLIQQNGEARAVDIAQSFGVSHVTVTKTISRLQRDGLVTSAPYRSIFLTAEGKRIAQRARQRHQIVLQFLRAIGVPRRDATIAAMKRHLKQHGE